MAIVSVNCELTDLIELDLVDLRGFEDHPMFAYYEKSVYVVEARERREEEEEEECVYGSLGLAWLVFVLACVVWGVQ